MKTFTIDSENNITIFASKDEAGKAERGTTQIFSTEKQLLTLAEGWGGQRLVEVWNSIPGFTPVKKFTSMKVGVARIWKTIQKLDPAADAGSSQRSRDVGSRREAGPKVEEQTKVDGNGDTEAKQPRDGTKNAAILNLLRRDGGATLQDLRDATGWQAHSVRGFLAGTVRKKLGLALQSIKREDGQRVYQVPA